MIWFLRDTTLIRLPYRRSVETVSRRGGGVRTAGLGQPAWLAQPSRGEPPWPAQPRRSYAAVSQNSVVSATSTSQRARLRT